MVERMEGDWDERWGPGRPEFSLPPEGVLDAATPQQVELLLRGLDHLPLNEMVCLDIGCGVGRFEKFLAKRFKTVLGVDVSGVAIEMGRERLREYPNVILFKNNGIDLSEFKDGMFDFVFSYLTFQHLPRKVFLSYLREAARVLRPGGIFRFQVFEKRTFTDPSIRRWLKRIRQLKLDVWSEPSDDETWVGANYTRNELKGYLKSKFERIEIKRSKLLGWDIWVTCIRK